MCAMTLHISPLAMTAYFDIVFSSPSECCIRKRRICKDILVSKIRMCLLPCVSLSFKDFRTWSMSANRRYLLVCLQNASNEEKFVDVDAVLSEAMRLANEDFVFDEFEGTMV